MSRKLKEMMVSEFASRFEDIEQHGCVVVGFRGIDANQSNEMRAALAERNARMMVVRNRLMYLALDAIDVPGLRDVLNGPAAFVTGENPVEAAKAVDSASEQAPTLTVLGGYAEGQVIGPEEVEKLADLPDRETLLSQTISCLMAPAQRFVNGLNSTAQKLASVLRQIKEDKEESE